MPARITIINTCKHQLVRNVSDREAAIFDQCGAKARLKHLSQNLGACLLLLGRCRKVCFDVLHSRTDTVAVSNGFRDRIDAGHESDRLHSEEERVFSGGHAGVSQRKDGAGASVKDGLNYNNANMAAILILSTICHRHNAILQRISNFKPAIAVACSSAAAVQATRDFHRIITKLKMSNKIGSESYPSVESPPKSPRKLFENGCVVVKC